MYSINSGKLIFFSLSLFVVTVNCDLPEKQKTEQLMVDTSKIRPANKVADENFEGVHKPNGGEIVSKAVSPDSIVAFARTLLGVPYLYASTDPANGFDCSGFITYVFNHFAVKVPRSSVDFTYFGKEVTISTAKPGDLILFTGTDSSIRIVGHMGIIESRGYDQLFFIHSTSGKAKGVVITPLEKYYMSRFVKIIRVFPDELFR